MNLLYKYHRPLSVIYHGNIIQVPSWAKWIAIDSEGFLWAYRTKPSIDNRAKRYRANGEEEKVSAHLFSKKHQMARHAMPSHGLPVDD